MIRARRMKLFALFLLSLGMVAASAWLTLTRLGPLSPVALIPGGAGILFFGLTGGWILARLFSHRVSLILDRNGLLDNSTGFPAGRIAWDQISRVGIASAMGNQFVGIDVVDRTALATSSSRFRRYLDETNAAITGFPVNIPPVAIDRSLEELRDLILKYWQNPKDRKELGISNTPD